MRAATMQPSVVRLLAPAPGSHSRDPEAALLAQWRHGDPTAGVWLVRHQVGVVRRYFSRRVPCSADAEDLVQRALMAAVEALPRYREEVPFSQFVRAIANKLLLRYRRDRERARGRLESVVEPDAVEAEQPSAQACIFHEDARDRLQRVVRELPEASARLLHLRYWEGRNTTEIAEQLALSPGAVRTRLHRARREVKRALRRQASDSDVWPLDGL